MKKIITTLLVIFISGLIGFYIASNYQAKTHQTTVPIITPSKVSTAQSPVPAAEPQTMQIPSLNVKAKIEKVGKTSSGAMDIPRDANNVAWYELGPKPGEKGSAVIAGHFDKSDGSAAVFYNLSNLKPQDKIIVTDQNGKSTTFIVTFATAYPFATFPIEKVFGNSDTANLNLITCAGTWDVNTKNYSNRYVVFSKAS
ncbi:class F sortase [Candidatus Curtissbacteria bacterium]|nr:class F sortase [Candidatus Curtissbacteria bacterium]